MLRAQEAGNSRMRGWSHCSGSYMPSWKMSNYYCLCPSFYMVLGKLLKPIFSQVVVDFWVAFSECPVRKRPSDSVVWSVKCWALQDCGCCAFAVWSVCISATKTNATKNELKVSWSWLSKLVNDYDLDLFFILYLCDSFIPLCFIIYSDKSLFVKY